MADGDSDSDSNAAGTGDPNVYEESAYLSDFRLGPSIPHYYGDYVRQIFILCGVVMLVFAPFLSGAIPGALLFEVGGAIAVVILGALTNPQRHISSLANAIAAGVGILTYELLALQAFYAGATMAFIQREALAVAFLIALYFSLKTFRNMMLGNIGKKQRVGDFYDAQS